MPYKNDIDRKINILPIPLDYIDWVARICNPIFLSINENKHISGKFIKDYHQIQW